MTHASRFLRSCAIGCATVAAMVMIAMVAPRATSARRLTRSLVLSPKFTQVAGVGNVGGLNTSARYVVVATNAGSSIVIDDQTGAQQQLPTGCVPTALGGVTVALDCQFQESRGQETLYDLQTGQSSMFMFNPMLVTGCEHPSGLDTCPWVTAIGSDWVVITALTHNYHRPYVTIYQSRATGQIVEQPSDPKLNVDLNTSGLISRVCSPLAIPQLGLGLTPLGSLLSLGHGFEIATGNQVDLQRCGTHLRLPLYPFDRGYSTPTSGCVTSVYCPPATNAHTMSGPPRTSRPTGYSRSQGSSCRRCDGSRSRRHRRQRRLQATQSRSR